jgi:uncharacterized protein YndB with AHSA1/START domain
MIVKSVVLACDPARAFALFTEQAGLWWPAARRHSKDAASTIRMEAAGRFFERSGDGTEVELGVVRHFEPARRLLLDWYPGTGPEHPTQVEVTFVAEGPGTRVTVRHSRGSADPAVFAGNVLAYDGSWDLVLAAVARHA